MNDDSPLAAAYGPRSAFLGRLADRPQGGMLVGYEATALHSRHHRAEALQSLRRWRCDQIDEDITLWGIEPPPAKLATVRGIAAPFLKLGYTPRPTMFSPGAFRETLEDAEQLESCFLEAWIDHDSEQVVGSTKDGSLALREFEKGLTFALTLLDNDAGWKVIRLIQSGKISGVSCGYKVADSVIHEVRGRKVEAIRDVELYEISLLTKPKIPAFQDTWAEIEGGFSRSLRRRMLNYLERQTESQPRKI